MVDLSRSSLNFLTEILVQMRALYGEIANEIKGIREQSVKVPRRADGKAKQRHTTSLDGSGNRFVSQKASRANGLPHC